MDKVSASLRESWRDRFGIIGCGHRLAGLIVQHHQVALGPLDRQAAAELLAQAGVAAREIERINRFANGHPPVAGPKSPF